MSLLLLFLLFPLNLATGCNDTSIHDACHGRADCEKVLIDSQSLSCIQSGQLHVKPQSSEWEAVTSVSCHDDQWRFISSSGTIDVQSSKEIDVLCRKPKVTSTARPPVVSTSRPVVNPRAIAQKVDNSEAQSSGKKNDESLPGSKWIWIGTGVALVAVIIIVNVAVCLVCAKRNKNTKKQNSNMKQTSSSDCKDTDKATNPIPSSENAKGKKGGKPPSAESTKPSAESTKPSAESTKTSAESMLQAPTELDMLKTEMIN